jgi:hypothetical protein
MIPIPGAVPSAMRPELAPAAGRREQKRQRKQAEARAEVMRTVAERRTLDCPRDRQVARDAAPLGRVVLNYSERPTADTGLKRGSTREVFACSDRRLLPFAQDPPFIQRMIAAQRSSTHVSAYSSSSSAIESAVSIEPPRLVRACATTLAKLALTKSMEKQ